MNPSASKVADLFSCAYPFRHDVELAPDESGPWARVGKAMDRLVDAFVDGEVLSAQDAARLDDADEGEVLARWPHLLDWLSTNIIGPWATQAWMIWNARTDRTKAVTREEGRKTKRGPLELSCIADLMAQTGPDEATVYDVKSGKVSGAKPEQLLTLGVAARRWFGVTHVKSAFVFSHKDGVHVERYNFTPDDLDAHALRLEAYLLEVPTSVPTVGAACRFCRVIGCEPGHEYRRRLGWPLLKTG